MKMRFATLLLSCLALLGACRTDIAMTVNAAGEGTLVLRVDKEGGRGGLNCSRFQETLDKNKDGWGEGTAQQDPNNPEVCMVTIKLGPTMKAMTIRNLGDSITVNIFSAFFNVFDTKIKKSTGENDLSVHGFSITIEMPANITSVSNGGQVSGNKATWTDYNSALNNGIEVTSPIPGGQKTPTSSPTTSSYESPSETDTTIEHDESTPAATNAGSSDKPKSGLPPWGWVVIGVGSAAMLGLFVFLVIRKKGGDYPGGYPAPGAGYFQPAGPPPHPGTTGFDQPPYGYGQSYGTAQPQPPHGSAGTYGHPGQPPQHYGYGQ